MREEFEKTGFSMSSVLMENLSLCNSESNEENHNMCWSAQLIEEVWLQYSNACFTLFVSNVKHSLASIREELINNVLSREGICDYEKLLDDVHCFQQLELEV